MEMTPIPPLCTQIHVIRIAIRVICVVHDVIGPRPQTSEPPPARRPNGKYGLLKPEGSRVPEVSDEGVRLGVSSDYC